VIRRAFRMSVNAGSEAEYERRHNPVWRDLEQVLLDHGVATYSIFLDPVSRDLFAYVEFESEKRWREVADTEACRRWWRHMRDVMPANDDDSPTSRDLREVFHLERESRVAAVPAAAARVRVG
jgi:L-rhamnose mutarotase